MNFCHDKVLELSNDQQVLATVASTNALKFPLSGKALGGCAIDIRITTAFDGDDNLFFVLQDSADGSSYADVSISEGFAKADLPVTVGGEPFLSIPLPNNLGKFVRLQYRVLTDLGAAGAFTAGNVHAIVNTYT